MKTCTDLAVARRCSVKQLFIKILQNPQEKPVLVSLFNKVATLKKETPTHVFFHKLSEISNNTFFFLPVATIKTFKTKAHYNHMLHENTQVLFQIDFFPYLFLGVSCLCLFLGMSCFQKYLFLPNIHSSRPKFVKSQENCVKILPAFFYVDK